MRFEDLAVGDVLKINYIDAFTGLEKFEAVGIIITPGSLMLTLEVVYANFEVEPGNKWTLRQENGTGRSMVRIGSIEEHTP